MIANQSQNQLGTSVGAKLRAARQARKYTQSKLASPDFSVSYISAIERGQIRPSLRALEIFAQRLGLSSSQLLPEHAQNQENHRHAIRDEQEEELTALEIVFSEVHLSLIQGASNISISRLEKLHPQKLQPGYRMHYHYLLGWAYLNSNDLQKSENELLEAEILAQDQHDHFSSLNINALLGLVYAAMDNHARALMVHQQCMTKLQNSLPRDPVLLCRIYAFMGQNQAQLNNYEAASNSFKEAIAIADQISSEHNLQATYAEIAQYYITQQHHYLANVYTHKSLYLNQVHEQATLKSQVYFSLGEALLKSNPMEARAFLDQALQQKSNQQATLTRASISVRLAEWFLLHDKPADAENYAESAYTLATPFGDTLIAVEALYILGRIADAQGAFEKGDSYFVGGLTMLERMEQHDELSRRAAFYAQRLDDQGKTEAALAYYKRAYESQRKVGKYN